MFAFNNNTPTPPSPFMFKITVGAHSSNPDQIQHSIDVFTSASVQFGHRLKWAKIDVVFCFTYVVNYKVLFRSYVLFFFPNSSTKMGIMHLHLIQVRLSYI